MLKAKESDMFINNKATYHYFIEADRIALGRKRANLFSINGFKQLVFPDHVFKFQKLLRRLEYVKNCRKGFFGKCYYGILLIKYNHLSVKLGFSISINTFGPGLSIAHAGPIIINKGVSVGANCRINASVNIGTAAGYSHKAPVIGNNVYIGPGAKIFGEIVIADNIAIGANSVVNKSFLEPDIMIAGVPAKKIKAIEIDSLLIQATFLMDNNLYHVNFAGLSANAIKQKLKQA